MENRYQKFVFEAEKGVSFDVSTGDSGELVIKAIRTPTVSAGEYAETKSFYTDVYGRQAIIPKGWTVSGLDSENTILGTGVSLVIYCIPKNKVKAIDWKNEYVVRNLQRNYSQMVWIPVESIHPTAIWEGHDDPAGKFEYDLGRRRFIGTQFGRRYFNLKNLEMYHEEIDKEEIRSIKKYGGFYYSRYEISRDTEGFIKSIRNAIPCQESYMVARQIAASFEWISDEVVTHLPYGAEYDTVAAWLMWSEVKSYEEMVEDSSNWGYYWDTYGKEEHLITGAKEEYCANNIYDFAGNVAEMTQEMQNNNFCVVRGGDYRKSGKEFPAVHRSFINNMDKANEYITGFRVSMYVK